MKNRDLNKNIKDTFDGYFPGVDTDAVWENIEPHLDKKKKRRFLFLWLLPALAGLGWLFFGTGSAIEASNLTAQKEQLARVENQLKNEASESAMLIENNGAEASVFENSVAENSAPITGFSTKKTTGTLKRKQTTLISKKKVGNLAKTKFENDDNSTAEVGNNTDAAAEFSKKLVWKMHLRPL